MTWFPYRGAVLAFLLVSLALSGGCGKKKKDIPQYKAKGKILLDDKPIAGLEVMFFTTDKTLEEDMMESKIPRPHALTKGDGSFTLGTKGDGDGAPAGEYKVVVSAPSGRGFGKTASSGPTISKKYKQPETSPLKVTIKPSPDNELYTLKVTSQ
jgi:hypothetical protein